MFFFQAENKTRTHLCIDCAFKKSLNTPGLSIEQKLTKEERNKKTTLENFIRRLDLFKGCLSDNVETNKRKLTESQQRHESDVIKVKNFFEQIFSILSDVHTK